MRKGLGFLVVAAIIGCAAMREISRLRSERPSEPEPNPAAAPRSRLATSPDASFSQPPVDMQDAVRQSLPNAAQAIMSQQVMLATMGPSAGSFAPAAVARQLPPAAVPPPEEPADDAVDGYHSFLVLDLVGYGVRTQPGNGAIDGLAAGLGVLGIDRGKGLNPISGFGGLRSLVRRAIADGVLGEEVWERRALSTGELDQLTSDYGLKVQVAGGRAVSLVQAGLSELSLSLPPAAQKLDFDGRGNMIALEDGATFIRLNGSRGRYVRVGLKARGRSAARGVQP